MRHIHWFLTGSHIDEAVLSITDGMFSWQEESYKQHSTSLSEDQCEDQNDCEGALLLKDINLHIEKVSVITIQGSVNF